MVRQIFMQRCLLQNKISKFLVNSGSSLHMYLECYVRFNIFMIRTLTSDIQLSSFAEFSLLRRICCTRIIVSFGIPDNDSVV